MNRKFERTTEKERGILQNRVLELIEDRQDSMDQDIGYIKAEFPNIRKVTALKYNPRNLFIEMKISDLYEFYYNCISDREQYHVKNDNYKRLVKALGL